ncbi:MAG: hypothetical protein JSU63_11275 [Phycisphaerales bacterium]|nr:MAG: hypothetical protein JSU63_11275 [Phycisphaerales bacterium]
MIDFSKLRAPEGHGEVLIEPHQSGWLPAARANADSLSNADVCILGEPLRSWRKKTRQATVGADDCLVFVTGHQPELFHPGVWAKHVVSSRLAEASGGRALNLVVDSDVIKQTSLPIPAAENDRLAVRRVPFVTAAPGCTYEDIPAQSQGQIERFRQATVEALGIRYERTHMPIFFEELAKSPGAKDWTDQVVGARRAVEAGFGVALEDQRVSTAWYEPLILDILLDAPRLAASYNKALASYRQAARVRGSGRPVPDLECGANRCEVPLWARRSGMARCRLFVERRGDSVALFADSDTEIGEISVADVVSCDGGRSLLAALHGWQLRPRALVLTMWARLLLADLFIHGIGGAKYDRISDTIIDDYYGLTPPYIACASATLHLDLPQRSVTPEAIRSLQHEVRDLRYNPQRHIDLDDEIAELVRRRADAVLRSIDLRETDRRNHSARRQAFSEIRESSAAMLALRTEVTAAMEVKLAARLRDLAESKIARSREYFFALFDRDGLMKLAGALPGTRDFLV